MGTKGIRIDDASGDRGGTPRRSSDGSRQPDPLMRPMFGRET
ncbi:hypothetical protein ACFQZZ_13745 [Nocardia sp. GCM10030253]